jgi:hypothetical protein
MYLRASFDQSNSSSSEFEDRHSLSSSPSTEHSGLLSLQQSTFSSTETHKHERRASRSKRRSWRLSPTSSLKPLQQIRSWSPVKPPLHVGKNGPPAALDVHSTTKSKHTQRLNDSMVYLQGANVYSCGCCRTHLTSHDDIVSKSFHGRHGRAYLFNSCVNVTQGPSEQRRLITGLHTVCDIFCKRCETLVGWTYLKAHESNQKYKEGKFIVEKINLHAEPSGDDWMSHPVEYGGPTRNRSSRWGDDDDDDDDDQVFEYEVLGS